MTPALASLARLARSACVLFALVVLTAAFAACGSDGSDDPGPPIDPTCGSAALEDGSPCTCPGDTAQRIDDNCFYTCTCSATTETWTCVLQRCTDEGDTDATDPEGNLTVLGEVSVRLVGGEAQEVYGPGDEVEVSLTLAAVEGATEDPVTVFVQLTPTAGIELQENNIELADVAAAGRPLTFTFRVSDDAPTGQERVTLDAGAVGYSSLTRVITVDVVNTRPRLLLRGLRPVTPGGDFNSGVLLKIPVGERFDLMGEIAHTGAEALAGVTLGFSTPNPGSISFDAATISLEPLAGTGGGQPRYVTFRAPATAAIVPGNFRPAAVVSAQAEGAISATLQETLTIEEPPPLQLVGEPEVTVEVDSRTQCAGLFSIDIDRVFGDGVTDPCPQQNPNEVFACQCDLACPAGVRPQCPDTVQPFECLCEAAKQGCDLGAAVGRGRVSFRVRNNSDRALEGWTARFISSTYFCAPSDTEAPCGTASAPAECHEGPNLVADAANPSVIPAGEEVTLSADLGFTQATGLAFTLELRLQDADGFTELGRFRLGRYNR